MFVDHSCKIEILAYLQRLTVFLNLGDGKLDIAAIMGFIDFEGFLLSSFRRVCPIALRRFFDTIDITGLATADPYFLEVIPALVVVQVVDGEDLLALDGCESEDGRYLVIPVLELTLVEQDLHVGVVDDGLLHNRGVYDIIEFLGNDSGDAVELSHRLVEILDVFSHRR